MSLAESSCRIAAPFRMSGVRGRAARPDQGAQRLLEEQRPPPARGCTQPAAPGRVADGVSAGSVAGGATFSCDGDPRNESLAAHQGEATVGWGQGAPETRCRVKQDKEAEGLTGTTWELVAIRSMDDAEGTRGFHRLERYALGFASDSRVSFRIDCNRGSTLLKPNRRRNLPRVRSGSVRWRPPGRNLRRVLQIEGSCAICTLCVSICCKTTSSSCRGGRTAAYARGDHRQIAGKPEVSK